MTAHELARELLKQPDVMVTVRGYEGGVNEVTKVHEPDELELNRHPEDEWWYGRHEYLTDEFTEHKVVKAVHIG